MDMLDDEAVDRAMADHPSLIWIETPSNPLLRITDIADRAARAKTAGALVIAANTLPPPCRPPPLALGCDLVMHSTTNALNGPGHLFRGTLLARDPALVDKLHLVATAAGPAASAPPALQTLR